MNLKEIILKKITDNPSWDLFTMVRWLYLYTCYIFSYDWKYFYENEENMQKIYDKQLNIININEYEIICSTWANLFLRALKILNIKADIKFGDYPHCFVTFELDDFDIIADATKGYDFSRVKIGCSTNGFKSLNREKEFKIKLDIADDVIGFKKKLYTDEAIKKLSYDFYNDGYNSNQSVEDYENFDYNQLKFKLNLIALLINDTGKVNRFYDTYFYLSYLCRNLLTTSEKNEILIQDFVLKPTLDDIVNFLAIRNPENGLLYLLKKENFKYSLVMPSDKEIDYYLKNYEGNFKELIREYKK